MKVTDTAHRLREYMSSHNLRQVDILVKVKPYCEEYDVKMNKSDLSQYVSGKTEPGQDKLFVLAKALGVSEPWLLGYDVPMEKAQNNAEQIYYDFIGINTVLSEFPTTDINVLDTRNIVKAIEKTMEINKMILSTPRIYVPGTTIDEAVIGLKFLLAYYHLNISQCDDDALAKMIDSNLFRDFIKNMFEANSSKKLNEENKNHE